MFNKEIIEIDNLPINNKFGATYSINQNNVNSYTHCFLNIHVSLFQKYLDGQ